MCPEFLILIFLGKYSNFLFIKFDLADENWNDLFPLESSYCNRRRFPKHKGRAMQALGTVSLFVSPLYPQRLTQGLKQRKLPGIY